MVSASRLCVPLPLFLVLKSLNVVLFKTYGISLLILAAPGPRRRKFRDVDLVICVKDRSPGLGYACIHWVFDVAK